MSSWEINFGPQWKNLLKTYNTGLSEKCYSHITSWNHETMTVLRGDKCSKIDYIRCQETVPIAWS